MLRKILLEHVGIYEDLTEVVDCLLDLDFLLFFAADSGIHKSAWLLIVTVSFELAFLGFFRD